MSKTRVAVLRGGPSEEYDVSMKTGASVLSALDGTRYEPVDIVITRSGEWLQDGFVRTPQNALSTVDLAFNGLHGTYGEDGTVQRLLDKIAIPYTGSAAYSSAIAMNKALAKEHLHNLPIKVAPHMRIAGDTNSDVGRIAHMLEEMLGPECVVKPLASGSSIGVVIANGVVELVNALKEAFTLRAEVLVEKRIRGKEATCAVVEQFRNQQMYTLPAIEIVIPEQDAYFTHTAKYSSDTEEICPGRFTRAEKESIAEQAVLVHETLKLSQYSRSDFIVADDGIYFLEVNTLPGLTEQSLITRALQAVGGSHNELILHLLDSVLEKK
ncbi:MAG: D-alanine--D-alanine ligase, partial [Candidatus Paceibacterota bacterium]